MTVLVWTHLTDLRSAGPCEHGCVTERGARAVGDWKLTLHDHPAGHYCEPCKKQLTRGWATGGGRVSAGDRFPGWDVGTTTEQAAA